MKKRIKRTIKSVFRVAMTIGGRNRLGIYLLKQLFETAMEQKRTVRHGGFVMRFAAPNALCDWRARTFTTKEPETLEWIDSLPKDSILWDIGANIGLYSVYAAVKRKLRIWAFEPSVFNLEFLARNIDMNGLHDNICIVPFALSDRLGSSRMRMTTTEWGGALSTFGQNYGWDGNIIPQVFEFQTIGMSMAQAVQLLSIPQPDYIKLDVDGIEHMILKGGADILKLVKSILIEVNDDFQEQAEQCHALLTEAGLVLKEKRHSNMIEDSTTGFQHTYNQIWIRP